MLDPTPWLIDGASHSAAVARTLAYAATGGANGTISPLDLQVRELATPGTSVRVAPGAAVILSPYSGGGQQSYVFRNVTETQVPIEASGSAGARTWYVVATLEDPEFAGQEPADPLNHEYAALEAWTSINVTNKPFVPLAKIVVPANTATITQSMITDLRELAHPRRIEKVHARPRIASDDGSQNYLSGREPGGEYFPGGGGFANEFQVEVPSWATMMIIHADWLSIRYQGGKSSWGSYWLEYGTEYRAQGWSNKQSWEFATQKFAWDQAENSATYRTNWRLIDNRPVPTKLRGKNVTFVYKAAVSSASSAQTKVASMDSMGGLGCHITFIEAPESTWQGAN